MAAKKKSKKGKQSNAKKSIDAKVVSSEKDETTMQAIVEHPVEDDAKDSKSKAAKKTPKKNDKNKKPNIFVRGLDFIKSVFAELKKVNWLTGDELMKSSSVVAGIVAIMTFLVWICDSGLGALAALFIGS